jgi:hypothetical protein
MSKLIYEEESYRTWRDGFRVFRVFRGNFF